MFVLLPFFLFKFPHADKLQTKKMKLTLVDTFESARDDDDTVENVRFAQRAETVTGRACEASFAAKAEALGWRRVHTSAFDDRVRRIDCVFQVDGKFLLVDVKAAKKLSRHDAEAQTKFHWLELHPTGSLCSGESRMLALEVEDGHFALFDKSEVKAWILPLLKDKEPVVNSKDAHMRPYSRPGKVREVITLVDVEAMMFMCKGIL